MRKRALFLPLSLQLLTWSKRKVAWVLRSLVSTILNCHVLLTIEKQLLVRNVISFTTFFHLRSRDRLTYAITIHIPHTCTWHSFYSSSELHSNLDHDRRGIVFSDGLLWEDDNYTSTSLASELVACEGLRLQCKMKTPLHRQDSSPSSIERRDVHPCKPKPQGQRFLGDGDEMRSGTGRCGTSQTVD